MATDQKTTQPHIRFIKGITTLRILYNNKKEIFVATTTKTSHYTKTIY